MPLPKNQYFPSGELEDLAKMKATLKHSGVPGVMYQAAKETYDNPIINNVLAALPVTGEAMLANDVANEWQKGNKWTAGGLGLAGMLPFGGITKNIKPETLAKLSKYFDPSAIEAIQAPLDYKSRATTVLMSPEEFLSYAAKTSPNKSKLADIEKRFAAGDKLDANSLPFLQFDTDNGLTSITGHEGRHRANYLASRGVDLIPVNIKSSDIRWSEQADPSRFDYKKDWPEYLQNQDQTWQSPFPLSREGEYISTAENKTEVPDRFWNKEHEMPKMNKQFYDDLERELLAKEFEDLLKSK